MALDVAKEMLCPLGWDVTLEPGAKHAKVVARKGDRVEMKAVSMGGKARADHQKNYTRQWAHRLIKEN